MSDYSLKLGTSALAGTDAVECPSCGERVELVVDLSVPEQTYVEDCYVCCRPMVVQCSTDGGELVAVSVRAENE